ncbi:MAG TPA: glycosyltransferase [Candidatus Dormibacteraeota bacterium]|nr:glycosyltransferase [Candidatus Dormibacteraeota bacterium]
MGRNPTLVALAWARFQARTVALAGALGGEAHFVTCGRRRGPTTAPFRYLGCAWRTWRLLEARRPDRVLVVTPPVAAPLVAWAWCRRRGAALVVDCHTDTFHAPRWRWARPLHRWLLRRSRSALVHTEEALELVQGWRVRGLMVPDDVPDPEEAEPMEAEGGCATSSQSRPAVTPTVLVAGSLDGNEPVAETLAAAAALPEVRFRFTGDPENVPRALREQAPPNVVFTGFLPYPRFLGEMAAAQVVAVFSTDPHIMNRAAFEAVGLGRPLVLSDLPGLRARFAAGAIFAPNRPEAMAEAIARALEDRVVLAARSRALARHLRQQRADALERLEHLLAGPGGVSTPVRVLRITQHPYPHMPTVARDVHELLERGCEVDLICSVDEWRPQVPDASAGPRPGLRVYRIPIGHRRRPAIRYPFEYVAFFLAALGLAGVLGLRRRYAAVQVDNLPDLLAFAGAVPRWRGARLVFTMYELAPEMVTARLEGRLGAAALALTRATEWAATRWADHVIVVNRPCFDQLRARGLRPEKMSVVPNTVELPPDLPSLGERRDRVLVTHSTLIERYGIHVAVQAFALLRDRWPDLRLKILGDGEERPALERLVRDLGLAERVCFTGLLPWRRALAEVRQATLGLVTILPDRYTPFLLPTKLLEYAQLGVPAVCSRLATIEAYFPDDAVAYARPGDPEEVAAQVDRLLRDPEAARGQAERAARAVETIGWDRARLCYLAALGIGRPGAGRAPDLSQGLEAASR